MKNSFSRCSICYRTENTQAIGKRCNRGYLNPISFQTPRCTGIMRGNLETERNKMKKRFLIALPVFPGDNKTWNHPTILVSAKNRNDAISLAKHLRPHCNIGRIEEVNY